MKLSIIIVNWNTKNLLKKCLRSIYQNLPQSKFEVFVVDNASADGSPEMVEEGFPHVKLIKNKENVGFAKANNQGIRSSSGNYLLLLNSDTLILQSSSLKMVSYMDTHPRVGILGPELITQNNEIIQMSWGWSYSIFREMLQKYFSPPHIQKSRTAKKLAKLLQGKERKVPLVAGASMLLRKEMLDKIGLLDENLLLYLEEADICQRAWSAGWEVTFIPDIKIVHLLSKSTSGPWSKASLIYRESQLYFYKKHRSKFQLLLLKIYLYLKFYIIYLKNRGENAESQKRVEFCKNVFAILKGELKLELD